MPRISVFGSDQIELVQIQEENFTAEEIAEWARFLANYAPDFVTETIGKEMDVMTVTSRTLVEMVQAILIGEIQ